MSSFRIRRTFLAGSQRSSNMLSASLPEHKYEPRGRLVSRLRGDIAFLQGPLFMVLLMDRTLHDPACRNPENHGSATYLGSYTVFAINIAS